MGRLLLAMSLLLLAGCDLAIRTQGIEATDTSTVVAPSPRTTIEKALGAPLLGETTPTGSIAIYEYDRGRPPEQPKAGGSGGTIHCFGEGCALVGAIVVGVYLVAQPYLIHKLYDGMSRPVLKR